MNAPLYTTEILRLAASLPAPVQLDRVDGSAEQRSPTCGSMVRLDLQVDENDRVVAVSQKVEACAFGQASAALVAASAPGRSEDEVAKAVASLEAWLAGGDQLCAWPGIEALAPARSRRSRHGAILLPFRALLAALRKA